MSRQVSCEPRPALSVVANQPSTQSARAPKTPREATRPERHQCLGVHNKAARPLSQPFVSATLGLGELLSISQRECGSPAPHPSRVLSPADGPLPRPFPCLSAAFIEWMLPPCTACACCTYPLRRHTSTQTLVDIFFPLCSGTSGIDCDGQWPVNDPFMQSS